MGYKREKQDVSACEILGALAGGDDIQLSQCVVTGVVDLNRLFDENEEFSAQKVAVEETEGGKKVRLSQSIVFDKCVFEENVVFAGPWAAPDSIAVEFENDVIFNSSQFKSQARFRGAVFQGTAGFDGCTFDGIVTFKNACVHGEAKFRTVTFNGYSLFGNAEFGGSARFTNSHFVKGVNFDQARFQGHADFSGVYSSSRTVPTTDSIHFGRHRYGDDESFWRFVKQSAQEAGYYQLAGEYFYKERCARLLQKMRGSGRPEQVSMWSKLGRWVWSVRLLPELIFGRMLFGYGERPARVLLASAMIIVGCAFYYSQPGILIGRVGAVDHSFMQGLYFSMITFTTLGYGDLYPAVNSVCRAVAMAEAVSGASLVALFIVCLAKRFSRG